MWYLDKMEANLTESDKRRLKAVYEPEIVAVPPDDSRRGTWAQLFENSTHLYVKSISDSCIARGYNGHCAWNRMNGALLLQHLA